MVYSLHQLKKFKKFFKLQLLLIYFYTAISFPYTEIIVWFGFAAKYDKKKLLGQ